MSKILKTKRKPNNYLEFDVSELIFPFIFFAIISPFFGMLLVKIFNFEFQDLGTYGDFLGGSTVPFLTVITILFIYKTYNLQQRQLNTQKKELSLLQEEMASTKETLQEQTKTTRMQRFENSFFMQINEIRNFKKEALEFFNNTRSKGNRTSTFDKYMVILRDKIDKTMKISINNSINELIKIEETETEKEYQKLYGCLLFSAFDESGIYDNNALSSFFHSVNRSLQFIYEYKNSMENWELLFYLDYLYDQIGSNAINLILINICMNEQMIFFASELRFDQYANKTYLNARRRDFDFFKYKIYKNPKLDVFED
ncbi:hypothetical protein QUF84_09065 [Fictibacillus enclensis]|uniref:hypothetical protein n=1 Tax=Fictibacillus enclensis TaxID=1017270 RepID=UPI0025A2AC57|nr:hypothetical protein [Fictibacillus enclensis]MDM5337363.1 hypothetical protein [Fictibacillus enclensis]